MNSQHIKDCSNVVLAEAPKKSLLRVILKGAGVLGVGQVSSYGLSFVRNMILARILTKADFGIAAALATAISLLEFTSKMALNRQIVQDLEGNSPSFQETAQAFQLIAGSCGALLVLFLSAPLARLFHVPSIWWAFAVLALIPLLKGFENLDIYRMQRKLNYLPSVLSETVSQFVVTVMAYPVAIWLKDFRAFVIIVLARSILNNIMSHVLAERPFRLKWNSSVGRRIFAFAWPLLINGFLLFASQQADQMVVGAAFSLEELSLYSISFSLVSIPWYISSQVSSSIFLPLLSNVQNIPEEFKKRYKLSLECLMVATLVTLLPLVIAGEQLVILLYGRKYIGAGIFVALLGVASGIRFIRMAPVLAAMAHADTKTIMHTNTSRLVGLTIAVSVVVLHLPVWGVAAAAGAGEMVALSVAIGRIHYKHRLKLSYDFLAVFMTFLWLFLGCGFALVVGKNLSLELILVSAIGTMIIALFSCYCFLSTLRQEVWQRWKGNS